MSSKLFQPIRLSGLTCPNRVVVAPMCQYSAENGSATSWHTIHLGSLALSGAGLLVIEATAVEPRGRITPGCLGLWSDENEAALAAVLREVRRWSTMPIGIQLAHAGRKASAQHPWKGGKALSAAEGAWETVGPSAIAFDEGWHVPTALDAAGMAQVKAAFVAAAKRADRLGLDLAELHCAHGYLMHQFLSPFSNTRTDAYGGSLENRMRFPLEVARAVRDAWPAQKPLGFRVSATEWMEGGFGIDAVVAFCRRMKESGYDFVCASSAGNAAKARFTVAPGYQVELAARIRKDTGLVTRAVGLIVDPHHAERILAEGSADIVALARGFLDDPHWAWHAAEALGADVEVPPQYLRSKPAAWPGAGWLRAKK